ncbi:MAG: hypothetical protein H0W30_02155 [Gemmatimonadaceae bacterium]|nr:hypothetical protein [Gemmatimonadaceae bacterium]
MVLYDEVVSFLMTVFPFSPLLADSERRSVLNKRIDRATNLGQMARAFLGSIRPEELDALAVPETTYFLASRTVSHSSSSGFWARRNSNAQMLRRMSAPLARQP